MNKNLIKGIVIIVLILLSNHQLKAQKDFRLGYIILNSGDTLSGQIDYRGDELMGAVCRFRRSKADSDQKYVPIDIKAYRFIDSKYYVSKEIVLEGKIRKVFLEFLIKAKVNVYYLMENGIEHYYIEKEGMKFVELPNYEELIYENGKPYSHKSTKHIGLLKAFFNDAPELHKDVNNTLFMSHHSLIKLAKKYHNKVCKDSICIVYEKHVPFIKINVELTAGSVNYSNMDKLAADPSDHFKDVTYLQKGALFHVWIPWASEKLYLRTGVLHTNLNFESGSLSVFKIPLQLEYYNSKGFIKPRLSYGMNFSKYHATTVSVMGGINFKIYKRINLILTSEADFTSLTIFIPRTFFAHSISGGIYFDL